VNSLANEVAQKALQSDLQTLSARVDTIVAHNNDTDGNSELLDVRTGYDGTVYGSAFMSN
jgi:hypothetical protein